MKIFNSQLRQELTVMARNGEQLLLLVVIPVMLLIFFSQTDFLPTGDENKINFLMPGILSLAVMSTAMVSLGIATGFERSYGVLKRLGTTPLGTRRLVMAKVSAICVIEVAQLVLLIIVGQLLGWNPSRTNLAQILVLLLIGTSSTWRHKMACISCFCCWVAYLFQTTSCQRCLAISRKSYQVRCSAVCCEVLSAASN